MPPAVFQVVQSLGQISQPDQEATLNQGVGMVLVVPESSVAPAHELFQAAGIASWTLGTTEPAPEAAASVKLVGAHLSR